MRRTAVALIDGEHYPSVVVDALREAGDRFELLGALFLGGSEKIEADDFAGRAEAVYGLPVMFAADCLCGLQEAIREFHPEVIVDLSDEPVLGYKQRFRLISEALARNVGYEGPDFHFSPTSSTRLCTSPSVSVVGTGKRVGKTAVCAYLARTLQEVLNGGSEGPGVVVVAMGRGGPARPEFVDGRDKGGGAALTTKDLLGWSRQGQHAASDYFEDALISRVATVGCRRCGGGMAGMPFVSNVAEGVALANGLNPGLILLEGSGAALPPVGSDARLLVAGAHQPVEALRGYLGPYRVLTSDALVLTMAEEPLANAQKVRALTEAARELKSGMDVVPVVFRPRPLEDVRGRRVAYFSTAPASQLRRLATYLEEQWGCRVEVLSANLADRTALRADLGGPGMSRVEMILTEIKAAAIDVVAEEGEIRGLPVVAVDNAPMEAAAERPGRLRELAEELADMARARFESGSDS